MLAGLKLFKIRKLSWNNFGSNRYSEKFHKNYTKTTAPKSLFDKAAGLYQIFVGDCFSNLIELSMVFGPVVTYSKNCAYNYRKTNDREMERT